MNTFVNDQDKKPTVDQNRSQTDPKANVQHNQLKQQAGGDQNETHKPVPPNPNPSNPDQNRPSE